MQPRAAWTRKWRCPPDADAPRMRARNRLLQGDITAGKMIFGVEGADPERRAALIRLLDIDLYQRLNTMSDGQRRRVQIAMGLLKPYDVRAARHPGIGRRMPAGRCVRRARLGSARWQVASWTALPPPPAPPRRARRCC